MEFVTSAHATRHRSSDPHPEAISFRDWRSGDIAVWGGRLRGMDAAIDLLLPLAAAAFGLTAIGVVFLICSYMASQRAALQGCSKQAEPAAGFSGC